jgi:hypothetical protein
MLILCRTSLRLRSMDDSTGTAATITTIVRKLAAVVGARVFLPRERRNEHVCFSVGGAHHEPASLARRYLGHGERASRW